LAIYESLIDKFWDTQLRTVQHRELDLNHDLKAQMSKIRQEVEVSQKWRFLDTDSNVPALFSKRMTTIKIDLLPSSLDRS